MRVLRARVVCGAAAGHRLPVLSNEVQAASLTRGLPGGIRQSREEPQNAEIGSLARGLKQFEEVRIEREAQVDARNHANRLPARTCGFIGVSA